MRKTTLNLWHTLDTPTKYILIGHLIAIIGLFAPCWQQLDIITIASSTSSEVFTRNLWHMTPFALALIANNIIHLYTWRQHEYGHRQVFHLTTNSILKNIPWLAAYTIMLLLGVLITIKFQDISAQMRFGLTLIIAGWGIVWYGTSLLIAHSERVMTKQSFQMQSGKNFTKNVMIRPEKPVIKDEKQLSFADTDG